MRALSVRLVTTVGIGAVALVGAVLIASHQETGVVPLAPRTPDVCADSRVRCATLTSGDVAVIYPGGGAGFVYWDQGGPGVTAIDGGAARQALPDWLDTYSLVTVVEPWSRVDVPDVCRVRAAALDDACPWDALSQSPEELVAAAQEIERSQGRIRGVVAASFGAVRSLPVMAWAAGRGGFIVVESPSALPATPGRRLIAERTKASREAILATPACTDCHGRKAKLDAFLRGEAKGVSASQAELAVLSLASVVSENGTFLEAFWNDTHDLTRAEAASLRSASYRFALKGASGVGSPQLAGYLAQMCRTYGDWPSSAEAFAVMHRPCIQVVRWNYGEYLEVLAKADGRVAVVFNSDDPVAPYKLQQEWVTALPAAHVFRYESTSHASPPDSINDQVAGLFLGYARAE